MLTESQVLQRIQGLKDPEIGRSFSDLDMLRGVQISGNSITVKIELPTPAYPNKERISDAIQAAVLEGVSETLYIDTEFSAVVKGTMSGGAIGLRAKNVIAVGSGKEVSR